MVTLLGNSTRLITDQFSTSHWHGRTCISSRGKRDFKRIVQDEKVFLLICFSWWKHEFCMQLSGLYSNSLSFLFNYATEFLFKHFLFGNSPYFISYVSNVTKFRWNSWTIFTSTLLRYSISVISFIALRTSETLASIFDTKQFVSLV